MNLPTIENDLQRRQLLSSLKAGMTPLHAALLVHVCRKAELRAINGGIASICGNGSWFQILTGIAGVGKSHLLDLAQLLASSAGVVVLRAEMKPGLKLFGRNGETRALISELLAGLHLPDKSGASGLSHLLSSIGEKSGASQLGGQRIVQALETYCSSLLSLPGGAAMVHALARFCAAVATGDLATQAKVLAWFRGDYENAGAAERDLGVAAIIRDSGFFQHLKLLAQLCRLAGFSGLLIEIDELGVLTRNLHGQVRGANLDVLLNIINDCHKGLAPGLGFLFAGTPDCLNARQGGLFDSEALKSRLLSVAPNTTAGQGNANGPILELCPFNAAELLVLLKRVRDRVLTLETAGRMPDSALTALITDAMRPLGADQFVTPRDILRRIAVLALELSEKPEVICQTTEATPGSSAIKDPDGTKLKKPMPSPFSDLKL